MSIGALKGDCPGKDPPGTLREASGQTEDGRVYMGGGGVAVIKAARARLACPVPGSCPHSPLKAS